MAEQAGPSLAAIRAQQSALATRHDSLADADRTLLDVLAAAHAASRENIERLDAIAEEIEHAVPIYAGLAMDTPLGAREFQRFLVAKQREIAAVVADARELDRAKAAVLERLRGTYDTPAG
ncbi:DUF4226 domain-containing protein [Mycobacterium sherrisii]|uniref:DUF4226 domain-containing protein n=1 Tax=Mycobacterium sherrisii TaxID=243061 RepID=UPI003974A50C